MLTQTSWTVGVQNQFTTLNPLGVLKALSSTSEPVPIPNAWTGSVAGTLHLALRSEDPELIDAVMRSIESRPDDIRMRIVRQTDVFGQTVLHRLCLWGASNSQSLEETLVEEDLVDSDVEEIEPALVPSVASSKCEKYIRALRLLGAKVNAQDSRGCTPLHTAAKTNNVIAAEVLRRFTETQPSIEDAKGCTPMDWAVVNRYGPIVRALRRRGATHWQTKLRPQYVPWQTEREGQRQADGWTIASL